MLLGKMSDPLINYYREQKCRRSH